MSFEAVEILCRIASPIILWNFGQVEVVADGDVPNSLQKW